MIFFRILSWQISFFSFCRCDFYVKQEQKTSALDYDHFVMQIAFPSKIICLTGFGRGSRITDNLKFPTTSARVEPDQRAVSYPDLSWTTSFKEVKENKKRYNEAVETQILLGALTDCQDNCRPLKTTRTVTHSLPFRHLQLFSFRLETHCFHTTVSHLDRLSGRPRLR